MTTALLSKHQDTPISVATTKEEQAILLEQAKLESREIKRRKKGE